MTTAPTTIAETAAGSAQFEILATALEATGLDAALADAEAALTAFAPTDTAFLRLAREVDYAGSADDEAAIFEAIAEALAALDPAGDPLPLLEDILLYHVAPGVLSAADIAGADGIETLNGAFVEPAGELRLNDLEPDLLDPLIRAPDIAAVNGILHGIDRVLLPFDVAGNDSPTIAEAVLGNSDFEVLTRAVAETGLEPALANGEGQLTLFAPTDAAFADLAESLGFEGDRQDADAVFDALVQALAPLGPDSNPVPVLADILGYHVTATGGAAPLDELRAEPFLETLGEERIIATDAGILDADPDRPAPQVIPGFGEADLANGRVQAVDGVLLRLDLPDALPGPTIADLLAASGDGFDDDGGDFDLLREAVAAAGLTEALADPDATVTVAAPTDAAFTELAVGLGADPAGEAAAFDAILAALTGLAADSDPVPLLTDILLYHVFTADNPFAALSTRSELADEPQLTSLLGDAPAVDAEGFVDADPELRDASFIDAASDIRADNGIIQAVDAVLLPVDLPEVVATGGPGAESFAVTATQRVVEGGAGADTATLPLALSEAGIEDVEGGLRVAGGEIAVDLLSIETLVFADAALALDRSEAAASVARLYDAGLGRAGDPAGLAFWTHTAKEAGLAAVADAVVASEEFEAGIGASATPEALVTAFYETALGRAPDASGRRFWTDALAGPNIDESDMLLTFTESSEYLARTSGAFDDGVYLLA